MKLTFDFNCIIALEKNETSAIYLNEILKLHEQMKVDVFVPAISGNEKQINGVYSSSLTQLIARLEKLTSRKPGILRTIMRFGMCFFDYCIFSSDELIELDKKIHNILFPEIPLHWEEYAEKFGLNKVDPAPKWINARCDVISMWCHIYYDNDLFITNDMNFFKQKKLRQLLDLGAKKVMKPKDAINYLEILQFSE